MREILVGSVVTTMSKHFDVDADQATAETELDDLGFDSLVLVELTLILVRDHSVAVSQDEVGQCRTIGDIADLLHTRGAVG